MVVNSFLISYDSKLTQMNSSLEMDQMEISLLEQVISFSIFGLVCEYRQSNRDKIQFEDFFLLNSLKTMNFKIFFTLFCLVCVGLAIGSLDDFEIEQPESDGSVVLSAIITNYLIKYLSEDQIFISIIFSTDFNTAFEQDQPNFEHDFFVNLFDDQTLTEFAHNTLNNLDNTIRDHRNSFNIILIDSSKTLS